MSEVFEVLGKEKLECDIAFIGANYCVIFCQTSTEYLNKLD